MNDAQLEDIDGVLTDIVKPARWPATRAVSIEANHLNGEPVSYHEAIRDPFAPFQVGERWGPLWGTTWFHVTGSVPPEWEGRVVALVVHLGYGGASGFGAEGLVWIDGRPVGAIDPNHREIVVGAPAVGGEVFELFIEAAANPPAPPTDPGPILLPDPGGEPFLTLRRCHLSIVDREVEALVRDWQLVRELVEHLEGAQRTDCLTALDAARSVVEADGMTPTSTTAARRELAVALPTRTSPAQHTHLAVGNSHIDTAWLWPLRETRRKVARTFSNASALLETYPEYRFSASQAQQFAWLRDDYPEVFDRVRQHVETGRFDLIGSMWVEADCNLASGESLVRQIVHGKRFFREAFGIDTPGLWLPDVFGYSAALPQILTQAGIEWFLTQKLSWNDTNRFPHHTFMWEGVDGSRIFTHFPPSDTYNGDLSVDNVVHAARNFRQRELRHMSVYPFGWGDGGGGPDVDMLERARRLFDLDDVGNVEHTTASDALARLRDEGPVDELPVWVGELYLEFHRGTYTTQGAVKRGNRELEWALRDAELWSVAASRLTGLEPPADELDAAWKKLLLHQFHDIIPGSSINWVYRDTMSDYAEVREVTSAIISRSLEAIGRSIPVDEIRRPALVTNSLPFERDEIIDIDDTPRRVVVPACGWTVIDLEDAAPTNLPPVRCGDNWMDNGILRVEWGDNGLIKSIWSYPADREAVAPGEAVNVLQLFDDNPAQYDAWDIDRESLDTGVDLTAADGVELIEVTPTRANLRVVRSFGSSRVEQRISLTSGSPRVDVWSSVDWHETHKLLKVAFPVDVRASFARHEIQFGHVERSTHHNTSWDAARFETCAHTWVDLSEDGFGVALLNDCKYGHDIKGNAIRLSLLRSPTWPDPLADRGHHEFSYSILPHQGSPTAAGVIAEAHAFNNPLPVVALEGGPPDRSVELPTQHSVISTDDPGIVISAVKAADDGDGFIVRLHEAFGGRRRVTLHIPGARTAYLTDLLERPLDQPSLAVDNGAITLELGPFQLVTMLVDFMREVDR